MLNSVNSFTEFTLDLIWEPVIGRDKIRLAKDDRQANAADRLRVNIAIRLYLDVCPACRASQAYGIKH